MSRYSWNRSPYFDDFISSKNYLRVLFQPGRPTQPRELNQIQSIFQNQIEKFANHIFKNGSKVSNARASYNSKAYVRLQENSPWVVNSINPNGIPVDLSSFREGFTLLGMTSGITARLVKGVNAENGDPPTLYVVYTSVAIDAKTVVFIPGEVINFIDENGIAVYSVKVKCPGCAGSIETDTILPVGQGRIYTIDEGVFYYEGMFIENSRQDIIVSKYGDLVNCKIGFDFVQRIVTSDLDPTLLDNTLGYPNSTAPGADRYEVQLVLTKRSLNSEDGDNFILLGKVEKGIFRSLKSDSEYSDIMDMIAKRTYETNGNYTVRPFKVKFIEDKAESETDPNGYSVDGDNDYFRTVVSDGISYVKGYRFENGGEQYLKAPKARDTKKVASFIKRFEDRTYILLKPLRTYSAYPNNPLIPTNTDSTIVNVYDGPFTAGNLPSGNLIGSFRVYDVMPVSGIINDSNPANSAVFKYYIYDLSMVGTHKLSEGKSFVDSNQVHGFKAGPAADNLTIYNPGKMELIWKLDRDNIRTLRSISDSGNPNPPGSITITLRKKISGILNSEGKATFTSYTNEYFLPYDPQSTIAVITDNSGGTGIIHTVDLGVGTRFTSTTTNITIDLGTSLDVGGSSISVPGNTITLIHNVLRTNAKENEKLVAENTINNITPTTSLISLGKTDVHKINYVIEYDTSPTPAADRDITSLFTMSSGVSDNVYKETQIQLKAGNALNSGSTLRWRVGFTYFDHDTSSGLGYYTVDSYKTLLADGVLQYEDSPVHTAMNKNQYPLFGSFDFRPSLLGTTFIGSAVPAINSTAIFDIEYYLGRTDLLCVDKNGYIYQKKGTPSDTPIPPRVDDDSMALYEVYLKPYTYDISDISLKFIENKRYTMRDIGRIEERIKTIEYYTVLNLLEKSAQDMSIKDSTGLDRFKNGFIADNFMNWQAGDIASSDFKAAIDSKKRELRPAFTPRNKKLKVLVEESDAIFRGKMAMIDYDPVMIDEQPFATKHISINPYFQYKKMGEMVLTPNNDTWADTNRIPNLTFEVNTGAEAFKQLASASGILGTQWGSWTNLNQTILGSSTNTESTKTEIRTSTNTTISTDQTRSGVTNTIDSRKDTYDFGDRVTDVAINPYMREVEIEFFVTKMKKNTKVWAFFDDKPVNEYVRPLKGSNGEQLITDADGQVAGIFTVPEGMFFTGDREFYLTNDESFTRDPEIETTAASATFFSGGINITKQKTTMNVITPTFKKTNVSENRTVTDTISTVNVVGIPQPPAPPPPIVPTAPPKPPRKGPFCSECNWCSGCSDPVAQSFKLNGEYFVTGFDVFFKETDNSEVEEIFFQLRNMVNGYPGETILAEKRHFTTDIISSEDSETPFHVEFDTPVYVQGGVEYCIVVGGFSPDTRIWVARLGQEVVNQQGKIIETQPSIGSSFRSQNSSTWNAEQFEDLKYRIYVAKFKKNSLSLKFEHIPESFSLPRDPFEAENGKNKIRVYVEDHGLNVNDKVTLSMFEDEWINVRVTNGQLQPGLKITTASGFEGTIQDLKTNQLNSISIKLKNIKGKFNVGEQWVCSQMDWSIHDTFLVSKMGFTSSLVQGDGVVRFNQVNGTFLSTYSSSINGIPLEELSKQHIVRTVDSIDSFVVDVSSTANESGRFGGEGCSIRINEKYELFNVSGAYLPYGSKEDWEYIGIGHNPTNGVFVGADYLPFDSKSITIGTDYHLGQPHKLISEDNKSSGGRMTTINASFESQSEWLSPVINTDTFSIVTVSNRIEWVADGQMNIEPNSIGRYRPECDPMNGSENFKYVTKTVNLKNPATDLVIAYDVYKDINSDYDIWIKVVAPYEGVDIDLKRWMRVVGIDKTHHSSDLTDRVDTELTMSSLKVEEYTSNTSFVLKDWTEFSDAQFSSFKLKIVGKSKNSAKPPIFQSLRVIAVT